MVDQTTASTTDHSTNHMIRKTAVDRTMPRSMLIDMS